MQESYLFEYAVSRVMPRGDREEFINVGVVLYCAKLKYLKAAIHLHLQKLTMLDDAMELPFLAENLNAIELICKGGEVAGPIGLLAIPERFRWLTATRSTVVQCSKVHPGFCKDPEFALQKLMEQFVL